MTSITETLSNQFILVTLSGSEGIKKSRSYDEGLALIQAHKGGVESSYSVSKKLYPKGYDTEIRALTTAFGAVRQHFYQHTIPYGTAGAQVTGRLLLANVKATGEFHAEHNRLLTELDTARTNFAFALPGIVSRLESTGDAGSDFSRDQYPSYEDAMASYTYKPLVEGFLPVTKDHHIGLPVSMIEAMTRDTEERAAAAYRRSLQQEAMQLLKFVQTQAETLAKLTEYNASNGHTSGKRQPSVYKTAFSNVTDQVAKLRSFAIPETSAGSAIIELCDDITATLDTDTPAEQLTDMVKNNPSLAKRTATKATELANALEADDFFANF